MVNFSFQKEPTVEIGSYFLIYSEQLPLVDQSQANVHSMPRHVDLFLVKTAKNNYFYKQ